MLRDRQQTIKDKGFNLARSGVAYNNRQDDIWAEVDSANHDYATMRVGLRVLDDAVINLGAFRKVNRNYGDKGFILDAIYRHNYDTLRDISDYFYEASGIYYRLCRYLAFLYRYDWYVTPYAEKIENENSNKLLKEFAAVLSYLDASEIKRVCGNISLEIMKSGVFYGIIMDFGDRFGV